MLSEVIYFMKINCYWLGNLKNTIQGSLQGDIALNWSLAYILLLYNCENAF